MNKNLVNKKKKKGFTLIELIIVIAIIAILAAVAIPKFGEVRASANRKSDIANAKTIANAAATLLADNVDVAGVVDADSEVAKYIQNIPVAKALEGSFTVTVNADGNITVTIGNVEAYPTPKGELAK